MTAQELREKYLKFFESKGHAIIPSASLIPRETDPSVLFTTAGMQQFKNYYLNPAEAENSSMATIQKCVRTIDIEEVGDNTHLTFFEMLGNFSFGYPEKDGSYFKEKTIKYAWEFLTKTLVVDPSRIYATYFKGENEILEDLESLEILKTIKELKKIIPQGYDDNFWSLGSKNSPGGPTVEFYIDGIEIWNCVFNEYILKNGKYEPASNKGVDTGMGLERLFTVLSGKESVYETELFQLIFEKISSLRHPMSKSEEIDILKSQRIIADHLKAATFMIADGVEPLNIGRGYVLRRLVRRAIRHGKLLGIEKNFLIQLAAVVVEVYKDFYPELEENKNKIFAELEKEENKFRETLGKGLKEFNRILVDSSQSTVHGKVAFDLYQTYGFPFEMTNELAVEKGLEIDEKGFQEELQKHQELSRTASAGQFKGGLAEAGETTAKLHTATHLLLAALREVLGPHVFQKGSNITAERLRLDFAHNVKMTPKELEKAQNLVNEAIRENVPVTCEEMTVDEAKKTGAVGVFESKYGDKVKVYTAGKYSSEICGGPHAKSTGELGHFKIVKEEASSAGVRRIKAILE
ncbi:MAG: alanine--tRNA ligase [Parcubacteria group bacterium]